MKKNKKSGISLSKNMPNLKNKDKIALLIVVLIALFLILVLLVLTKPKLLPAPGSNDTSPTMHQFYGNVFRADSSVFNSAKIYAVANGVVVKSVVSVSGKYGYGDVFIISNLVQGAKIEFHINSSRDIIAAESSFDNFATTSLDLYYDFCGDGFCASSRGESCSLCSSDCGNCNPGNPPTGNRCIDIDRDGFNSTLNCGLRDCNDNNKLISPSASEICGDNIDNNCNLQIDENCECSSGQTKQCGTTDIGECQYGSQSCINRAWGACSGNIEPSTEICRDELDNDCDNSIDEDCSAETPGKNYFIWMIIIISVMILVVALILILVIINRKNSTQMPVYNQ